MPKVKLKCPKCNSRWEWGMLKWFWKAPFHWMHKFKDYRFTKCPLCDYRSWITREK
jgi:DNA-directed RNA polymerase subunit RPC12/RpoP